jgi:group I intron endonuclease
MVVYSAHNTLNGKEYIGITARGLRYRIRDHHSHSKTENTKFYHAIRKHGFEAFTWSVIDTAKCITSLKIKEMQHIIKRGTMQNGYNSGAGGDLNAGWGWSDESKKRQSESKRRLIANGWKPHGMPHTDEQKAKWKAARNGVNHPAYGRKHTEAERRAISQKLKGKKKSETQIKKISLASRKFDYAKIVELRKQGLKQTEIMNEMKCCLWTVRNALNKVGIK